MTCYCWPSDKSFKISSEYSTTLSLKTLEGFKVNFFVVKWTFFKNIYSLLKPLKIPCIESIHIIWRSAVSSTVIWTIIGFYCITCIVAKVNMGFYLVNGSIVFWIFIALGMSNWDRCQSGHRFVREIKRYISYVTYRMW